MKLIAYVTKIYERGYNWNLPEGPRPRYDLTLDLANFARYLIYNNYVALTS
jgi:hypothetical protein